MKKKIFLLLTAVSLTLAARADEGMWLLPYLQKMNIKVMKERGCKISAEEIYSKIWNESAYSTENTVMVHIRRIREKIELNPKKPEYLKVVWGIGYKMEKMG